MIWCVLKPKKQTILSYGDYIPMFLAMFLTYRYADARANFIWSMLLLAGTLLYQLLHDEAFMKSRTASMLLTIFNRCQIPVYLVCLALTYGISRTYREDALLPFEILIGKIINLSTLRIRYRINAFYLNAYKPWLLGSILIDPTVADRGYFIDISYIRILILYGTLTFISVMLLVTYTQFRQYQNKNYYLMFVLSIVALNSMMEQHLTIFQINVFIFAAFTVFHENIGKSKVCPKLLN